MSSRKRTTKVWVTRSVTVAALVALAALVVSATASARYYVPRPGHACKANHVRHTVKVRKRLHGHIVRKHGRVVWIKQTRCVYVAPKVAPTSPTTTTTTTTPAPTVHYLAHVDPTFTQDPTNPLSITIDYSADATSTLNGVTTDLATTGSLPAGVLELYSTYVPDSNGQPGSGATLLCAINVGGSVTGGTCGPKAYAATGSYELTTTYIVSATSSTTDTQPITINPYPSTTRLVSTTANGQTTYAPASVDENGNAIVYLGDASLVIVDATTGQVVGGIDGIYAGEGGTAFQLGIVSGTGGNPYPAIFSGARPVTGPINPADSFTIQAVYGPRSGAGWTGSQSQAQPLVFSP